MQSDASSSSTKVGAASGGAAAKQLFLLLVSCLKAAGQLIDDASSSSSSNVDSCGAAGESTNRTDTLAALLAPAGVCSKTWGAIKHVGGQQLQLLLHSRCLSQAARLALLSQQVTAGWLQAQQEEEECSASEVRVEEAVAGVAGKQLTLMAQMLESLVVECMKALTDTGLQLPGEPTAAAAALSKLQRQGKCLQEQLQLYAAQQAAPVTNEAHQPVTGQGDGSSSSMLCSMQAAGTQQLASQTCEARQPCSRQAGSSGGSSSTQVAEHHQQQLHNSEHAVQQQQQPQPFQGEQAEQLARDVQQFGDAICLQLPVSFWCCNPRCSSVQQHSELELVSGKGSRCSGCAAARFCSRACQQQCWKGQHAPVCKRIAAARKGQTTAAVDESSSGAAHVQQT
jgi:hypothetical protein